MKIINGRIYNRIAPKTSKIYVINGEIYPAMFASGELMLDAPMVSTVAAQDITHDSVRLLGLLSDLGSSDYVHVFIQLRAKGETTWMQSQKLKIEESHTYFYAQVTNLQPEVEYEYRAGAEWELGVVYGNIYTFTTTAALLDTFIFGPDVTGDLYLDGRLEIQGSGDMTDFSMINSPIFGDARVITVNIGPGITSVGNGIFVACHNLTSVNIPNSVTKIGHGAFFECSELSSIVIPRNVESIGSEAFRGCYKLAEIRNHFIGNQIIGSQAFYRAGEDVSLKYAYSFVENTNFKNAVEAEGYVWVEIIIPSGASEATIAISAEGRGAKIAFGSSEAIVEVSAEGRGMKIASGSSEATIAISTEGKFAVLEMEWVPLGTFWSLDWDSPDDTLEATVTARDRMELLRKNIYEVSPLWINETLYNIATFVLQDAGLYPGEWVIDPGLQNIVIPYAWFEPISHRDALRQIAEAGLATVYADRDGKIRIESFASAGETSELTITEDDYFSPLSAPSKQEGVANEIVVTTQPIEPAAEAEEVYKSSAPVTIPAKTTQIITVYYSSTPVMDAAAILVDPPTGVSIVAGETSFYAWGAKVAVRNTTTSDQEVIVKVDGKPFKALSKERVVVRDDASILDNGVLQYEFPANPLMQTLGQAQAIANALLASFKDPRRDIEMTWRGNPALLLGDRITVKGKDYHVIRQELEWSGAFSSRLMARKAGD